jgi:hypothetical protein
MLIAAAVLVALSVGMWWLQRVAFSPSNDSSVAYSILGDEDIRGQVATIVAGADAPLLSQSPAELREFIEEIARIREGAALMSDFVRDAHGSVIGSFDGRVVITAQEQVNIVRNELVGEATSLTLPVQRVGSMALFADWLGWIAVGALALGAVIAIAGVVLRPERGEGTFALGVLFAATAGSLVIFGYLVPLLVLPALLRRPVDGRVPPSRQPSSEPHAAARRRLPRGRSADRVRHEQPTRTTPALDPAQRRPLSRRAELEPLTRTSAVRTSDLVATACRCSRSSQTLGAVVRSR